MCLAIWALQSVSIDCLAQGHRSSLQGSVRAADSTLLSDVAIELVHLESSAVRARLTDREGRFAFFLLDPGAYSLTATLPGFRPLTVSRVELELGLPAALHLTMTRDSMTDLVEVVASPELVGASTSALSLLVGNQLVQEIPLNGRDLNQLAAVQAGVHVARSQARNFNSGHGLPLSIAGSRPVQNRFYLDGLAIADHTGATPASINGLGFGVDAVQEFTILTSGYGPQFGGAGGGIISAVTRSGSNTLHGSVFYAHRNDNLDARNFFDPGEPPEFRRHQYGATLGGALVSEKTFFFANFERLNQARGNTTVNSTLGDSARQGILQNKTVQVDPAIDRLLDLYPRPNGAILGNTGLFVFQNDEIADDLFVTGRIDHHTSSRHRLMARYSLTDGESEDDTAFALNRRLNQLRNQSFVIDSSLETGLGVLNSLRAGGTRTRTFNNATVASIPDLDHGSLGFIPGLQTVGIVEVAGLTAFPGGSGAIDADRAAYNSFQLHDDILWTRGSHSVSLGLSVERTHLNLTSQSTEYGEFRFPDLQAFLENRPDRFRAQFPGTDATRGLRQWHVGAYLQDSWPVRPRLTLDFGLRWEWSGVPTEVNGKLANLESLLAPEMTVGELLYRNPSWTAFGPRVGFAWNTGLGGSTVIRGGYGLFHDPLRHHYLLLVAVRNPPFFVQGQANALPQGTFPDGAYQTLQASGDLRADRIPPDLRQPYVQQWNLTLEQRLGRQAKWRGSYLGSHGVHLSAMVEDANLVVPERTADGRLFYPVGGSRRNPAFGQIRDRRFEGHSFYHSLQTEFAFSQTSFLDFLGSYTWAKSIDDSSTTFAQTEAGNASGIPTAEDSHFNRGLSNHDIRHRLAVSTVWRLPSPASGFGRTLLREWKVAVFGRFTSGLPLTATLRYDAARTGTARPDYRGGQRPDVDPVFQGDPVTGRPEQWVDPAAFARPEPGFLGNLGRNTLPGPSYHNVDLALTRSFLISGPREGARLEFRLEAFNILNTTSFDLPTAARMEAFTSSGVPEDFGLITSAAPSREIQVGLRLSF